VKRHAQVLELEQLVWGFAAHDLDRVLVAKVIRPLDRVVGVRLPRVLRIQRRIDAALSRIRVRANRMDLRNDPNRSPGLGGCESGALASEASTDDQYVVLRHAARSLFTRAGRPPQRGEPGSSVT
jgi:hypothetical protein